MELISFKCPRCDQSFDNLERSLRNHAWTIHGIDAQQLYDILNGTPKGCACGCKTPTKFYGLTKGYSLYKQGHIARVKNNWGHNKDALNKSHETCRKLRQDGEMVAWNKGETKETNEAVKAYGQTQSQNWSDEKKNVYSKTMSQNRSSGVVPTLRGSDHSQWKGGVSSLQNICRSYLNRAWVFPKMKEADFTCERCRTKGPGIELNVHHSGERFADIVRMFAEAHAWTGDESEIDKKVMIAEGVSDYHQQNDVPGICVCHECHVKIHEELGERIN